MSTEEAFTVTNQLSAERPQVVAKDLTQPSPALSAYAMFFQETQASVKSTNPDATFEQLKQIVHTMWQVIGDEQKMKYEEKSNQDKLRYEDELAIYHKAKAELQARSVITTNPNATTPVKPVNTQIAGVQLCIRLGCKKPSIRNVEWEDEYCSSQCVVLHCDFVFREWVRDQQNKT